MRLLVLLTALILTLGCSKDDKENTVTVEYTVSGGNPDGMMTYFIKGSSSTVIDQKGESIKHSQTYTRDGSNMIMLLYYTESPVKEGFKMTVKVDGKVYDKYYLSGQSRQFTYEIDLPQKI